MTIPRQLHFRTHPDWQNNPEYLLVIMAKGKKKDGGPHSGF